MYDSRIGRWLSTDPAGQFVSPYEGMGNNPMTKNDPTGGLSPIYDTYGNFLGTDDQGLTGPAIIMDADKFTQEMSHQTALNMDLGLSSLSKNAYYAESTHYNNLSNRPDYDGYVTISEGIAWAKSHPDALSNPTPDNTLYIDASKLNFANITPADFKGTAVHLLTARFCCIVAESNIKGNRICLRSRGYANTGVVSLTTMLQFMTGTGAVAS